MFDESLIEAGEKVKIRVNITDLFGPRSFDQLRVYDLGPSLLTLNVASIWKVSRNRVPFKPGSQFFSITDQLLQQRILYLK